MTHGSLPSSVFPLTRRVRAAIIIVAAAALCAAAPRAAAQAVYGSIGGLVKDASGAIVPGATITITSLERKTVDTTVSNESGFSGRTAQRRAVLRAARRGSSHAEANANYFGSNRLSRCSTPHRDDLHQKAVGDEEPAAPLSRAVPASASDAMRVGAIMNHSRADPAERTKLGRKMFRITGSVRRRQLRDAASFRVPYGRYLPRCT